MTELYNFDLQVSGSGADGYTVQARGPAGEWASATLDGPLLADLAQDLAAIRAGQSAPGGLERTGAALFEALFPRDVMRVYDAARRASLEKNGGLRLRLHLPAELAALPWELLYDPPRFLCLDATTSVVRFLDLPDPPQPLAVELPLHLLYLVASPKDAPRLAVEQETEQIVSALTELTQAGKVEILSGRPGTLATLRDHLRHDCHVVHFSGHGGLAQGEGFLLFEDEEGYSQRVNSTLLAQHLNVPTVRLVILNACESAVAGTGDAFGSVAAALVRTGLPAVIAYQHAMPDSSAIPFAAEFYDALTDGYPVDAAVTEGRKAILAALGDAWRERPDWATPVLFLRAPDGRLWTLGSQAETTKAAVHIETIRDSTLDFRPFFAPAPEPAPPPPVDPLPLLLDELRDRVRDRAPREKRTEALEKVATLRGAATERRPNLDLLESIWKWFDAELPALSGAVLSAILEVKPRLQDLDDELVWDFEERFE